MADTITPSRVFPLPGFTGTFTNHGGPQFTGGSDIFAPVGTPIVSIVSGKVNFISTQATASTSGGNAVQILGDDGLTYYYAHMKDLPLVKMGDRVKAGQSLGSVGNTGNAKNTASHLHIGIGHGISIGTGAAGGIGNNFNAVNMLKALQLQKSANDPGILEGKLAPPEIHFVPAVSGFTSANQSGIYLNLKKAIEAGVDPFTWLGIVSKESEFNPNAKNPTSGACGYAQIYPCIPGLTPEENIAEGLKRYKGFLSQCSGDVKCALNRYSGGGGSSYINEVQARASMIKGVNPDIVSSFDPNADYNISDDSGDDSDTSTNDECPTLTIQVGPWTSIPFPDVGCIIRTTITKMVEQLKNWWRSWQEEHIPNWTFVLVGFALAAIGLLMFAQSSGLMEQAAKITPAGKVASMAKKAAG